MSRTFHKQKQKNCGLGKEYWKSRLHRFGEVTGRFTKILTHRKERRLKKKIERECLSLEKKHNKHHRPDIDIFRH